MLENCIRLILQKKNKKICLSWHYNKESSYLFVSGTKIIKFKSKDPAILPYPLYLRNILREWSVHNMKKTGLNEIFMILVLIMMLLQLMIF